MEQERKKQAYMFLKTNIMNFVVILVSVAYVFYGMIGIEDAQLSLKVISMRVITSIIVGLMIKEGIGENGFTKGNQNKDYLNCFQTYSDTCNLVIDWIDCVDKFYEAEELEIRKKYIVRTLTAFRIPYDWFFDDNAIFKDNPERFEKLDKKQRKALDKCIKVKIYLLDLFSEYGNGAENYTKKEKTDKDQRMKMLGKNSFSQVLFAIVTGSIMPIWNGFNVGDFILYVTQVCLWITFGIIQMYANYNYVTIEKVNKLNEKKRLITKFKNGCEKGLYGAQNIKTEQVVEKQPIVPNYPIVAQINEGL